MKILFYTNHYLRDEEMIGGVNIYLKNIVEILTNQGHFIHVIEKNPMGFGEIHTDFLTVLPLQFDHHVEYAKRILKRLLRFLELVFPFFDFRLDTSLDFLANSLSFAKQISGLSDLNVVQLSNLESIGVFLPAKRIYQIIIRASSYRNYWDQANEIPFTKDTKTVQTLEKIQFKKADKIIAPSKYLAAIVSEKIGKQAVKITSPLHVTFDNWDDSFVKQKNLNNTDYILYFGILSRRKGIFDLAQAMNLVWNFFPKLKIVIIGPDYNVNGASNLEKMKAEMIMPYKDENVIYHTELRHSLLFPVIQHSRFVVLPSIYDNCPNSLLESMEIGKPIISTFDSGNDEFFPQEYKHLLATKNNPEMLANRIIELNQLSNEELQSIGEIFKENINNTNNIDVISLQLLNLYQSL